MATWFGGTGSFYNPNNWNPVGVPQSGDAAVVQTGTVKVTNHTNDATFYLDGASKATQPVLQLTNDTMQSDIYLVGPPGSGPLFGKISVSGFVSSAGGQVGAVEAAGGNLTIHIAQQSTFVNTGTIDTPNGTTLINGAPGSVFVNDGAVNTGDGSHDFGSTEIDIPVTGTGTFQLGPSNAGSELGFGSNVSKGINVLFTEGGDHLVLHQPLKFLASITQFHQTETISLPNTAVTSDTFASNHLKLFDNGTLVANLNIIGDFQTSQFVLSPGLNGGTDITVNSNPAAATLPAAIAADHSVLSPLTHG